MIEIHIQEIQGKVIYNTIDNGVNVGMFVGGNDSKEKQEQTKKYLIEDRKAYHEIIKNRHMM